MAYRTDKPLPPVARLDAASALRLHGVATAYLQLPPAENDFRLDAADRAAMRAEIECQTPLGVTPIPVRTDVSDTYVAARYLGTYERTRTRKDTEHVGSWSGSPTGATSPLTPADGMLAGMTTTNEVKGNAKEQRRRQNLYLNEARRQLTVEAGGKNVNGSDVENRALILSKSDPLDLFK